MKKYLIVVPALLAGLVVGQIASSYAFTNHSVQFSNLSNSGLSNLDQISSGNDNSGPMGNGWSGSGNGYSGMMGGWSGSGSNDNNGYYGMMGNGWSGSGNGYSGMMGGWSGSGSNDNNGYYGMMGGGIMGGWNNQVNSIQSADVDKEMKSSLQNAVIDKNANSITFKGNQVNLVMLGKMVGSSNQEEDKFVIGGLVNPTIHVQNGAKISMTLINEDDDMPHGIEITPAAPPYPYMSMMAGGIFPGSFIPPIPESKNDQFTTASTTFTANQSGNFYYICQYPGHAEKGMYGKIIIG